MLHSAKHDGHLKKVRHVMKSSGYSTGKQNHSVRNTTKAVSKEEAAHAIHKHEEAMHKGKPLTKLKSGGCADGGKPHNRLDKKARGGKNKGHVHVNVIVPQGGKQPIPVPMGGTPAPGGMAAAAARPPVPAPMGAPAGMPPRPPGMKTGGKMIHEEYGAGSGEGRLANTKRQKSYDNSMKKKKEGGYISSKDGSINVGS